MSLPPRNTWLGTCNPDWAVLAEHDGAERLFFVVGTEPSLFAGNLRGKEDAKIECGRAHFGHLSVRTAWRQICRVVLRSSQTASPGIGRQAVQD